MPRSVRHLLVAVAAALALAGPAAAQDMTTTDVSRLQQLADQVSTDLQTLRQRDRAAARAMSSELMDLEDEIIYLKVKLRKERVVSRSEYLEVRDRLENLRGRVRGDSNTRYGANTPPPDRERDNVWRNQPSSGGQDVDPNAPAFTVPSGTELDVRLLTRLSSETAQVEDRFEATTLVDVRQNGRVLIPAGSVVRGVVTDVEKAGRLERKGKLTLSFDQIRINGRAYPMRGSVTQALEAGGYKEDAEKIGAGAAVGAVIGGILGGVKGAITGILIGGGGVVAATEGQNVDLPEGTVLRMRLDQNLQVRANPTRQ